MEEVKNYIYSQLAKGSISKDNAKVMLKEIFEGTKKSDNRDRDVAIIGIACKFAGADNKDEYWDILRNGTCCIGKFPENRRKDTDVFLPENAADKGDPYMYAGYLDEIDQFDSAFFRIPPKEAELMDPAQRVFLETAWEAIEDAGLGGKRLYNSKTGVYVGRDTSPKFEYKNIISGKDVDVPTGTTTSILASRLAYILNLKGPGMVIDTACSSGLVSLHIAYQSIVRGEIDQAVVGGIALLPFPVNGGVISSARGKVSSFDKSSDGTVWGEGAGVVVLKSLADARKARDTIYAVIKGSALNNDGASNGLTAPSAESQAEVIKAAWENSGIDPETISYIEAHGTGTKLGDPIEAKGLALVFREFTSKKQFCGLGSVKTNIGHTIGAAGISSVIKMALALKNKQIPPSLNFEEPNPYIDFAMSPVYIVDRLTPWNSDQCPRRCGVSSFGFSGTNCHIVMEEAPVMEATALEQDVRHIFTLSAKSEKALLNLVRGYVQYLENNTSVHLGDICNTACKGRGHYNYRLAILSENTRELSEKIRTIHSRGLRAENSNSRGIYFGKYSIVLNKGDKKEWELSEEEKIALSEASDQLIDSAGGTDISERLCELYIKGADVKWERNYRDGQYRNIPLPVYRFDRMRHWVETEGFSFFESNTLPPAQRAPVGKVTHPILDKCIVRSMNEAIYATEFSVDKHWVLNEHAIAGKNAIPGTTYLETAVAAGYEYFGCDIIQLRNIQFYTPMVCIGNQTKEVQIVLRRQDEKTLFSAISCGNTGEEPDKENWSIHCTGEMEAGNRNFIRQYDLKNMLDRFGNEIEIIRDKKTIMGFGPRWKGIRRARLGENEAIVYLELLDEIKADTEHFTLHPALLDIATSIAASAVPGGGFYLPFGYRDVRIYSRIPSKCYSYISPLVTEKDREILKYNVEILDENGVVVVEINDFTMKKVHDVRKTMRELSASDIMYFEQDWMPEEPAPGEDNAAPGNTLVIRNDLQYGGEVVEKLRASGLDIIEAELGKQFKSLSDTKYIVGNQQEDYDKLLEAANDLSTILYLHSPADNMCGNGSDDIERNGLYSLSFMAGALGRHHRKSKIRLLIVSQNVYEVTGKEPSINPFGAALFALGKVISGENPNTVCKCIDMDDGGNADTIAGEIHAPISHNTVAYRSGTRYIPVIGKAALKRKEKDDIEIREDGFYLVTGGSGGIALEVCRYLASRANIKLVLINRTKLPPRSDWNSIIEKGESAKLAGKIAKIRQLEQEGAVVECISADISRTEEIQPVLEKAVEKYGRLNGIIHTAGVAGNGFMANKDRRVFDGVVLPKIKGSIVLDRLTEKLDMDFMILFSSIESFYASAGQGDYAAANSFLNSYAVNRNRHGKKTVSIAWPAWRETGMAFELNAVRNAGLSRALTNIEGINIFEEALSFEQALMIPVALNYENIEPGMKSKFPILLSDDVWMEIEEKSRQYLRTKGNLAADKTDTVISITGKDEEDFTELEVKLAGIWAEVLGLRHIDIYESLYSLGGDSLHSIKMLRKINEMFPGLVDISDIFTYSTISELAAFIEKKAYGRKEQEETADIDEILRKLANSEIDADEADKLFKGEEM